MVIEESRGWRATVHPFVSVVRASTLGWATGSPILKGPLGGLKDD